MGKHFALSFSPRVSILGLVDKGLRLFWIIRVIFYSRRVSILGLVDKGLRHIS